MWDNHLRRDHVRDPTGIQRNPSSVLIRLCREGENHGYWMAQRGSR
jgi:hypothetical protein